MRVVFSGRVERSVGVSTARVSSDPDRPEPQARDMTTSRPSSRKEKNSRLSTAMSASIQLSRRTSRSSPSAALAL